MFFLPGKTQLTLKKQLKSHTPSSLLPHRPKTHIPKNQADPQSSKSTS